MLRLLFLRLSIAVWKRSLSISSKLRPRTWVTLAALHGCIAVISFWAYQAKSVPESAIPPVYHAELQPVPLPIRPGLSAVFSMTANGQTRFVTFSSLDFVRTSSAQLNCVAFFAHMSPTINGFTWSVRTPSSGQPFNGSVTGTNFVTGGSHVFFQVDPFGLPMPKLPGSARPVVVQVPSPDQPYLLEPVQRTGTFICGVIVTFIMLVKLFFAWERRQHERAQAVLTALQTEKTRLEIAVLRQQWEKGEQEARRLGIIVSG